MFSIFNVHYLQGLSFDNLKNMIVFFGSRMGMFFSEEALSLLHKEYGGHPLLTRLACSFQHDLLEARNTLRPVKLGIEEIVAHARDRDAELSSYCGHVVSEIAELYPDEYEMLKMFAAGELADFVAFAKTQKNVRHIRDYGLIEVGPTQIPRFRIPVVKRFLKSAEKEAIALDEASRFGAHEQKIAWLKRRSKSIVEDLILLNDERSVRGVALVYPKAASVKGHNFVDMPLVSNEGDAISFLVHAHKYLVEPSDKFLKGGVAKNAEFLAEMPALRMAFMRLKAYRNKHCHIELDEATRKAYAHFLQEDFDAVPVADIDDGWFKMQRRILDGIHVALQVEICRI